MIRLTPEQSEKLVQLVALAVDLGQLESFVYLGTGDRLFVEFVGPGLPLKPTIRKLIEALELGPVTDKFLRVVYREKPFQSELRAYIAALYPDIAEKKGREPVTFTPQKAGTATGAPSQGPGLERNVKPALKKLDTEVWLARFETIKRQVCRVEVDGAGLGTGFLVGQSAVLTNWHVVLAARQGGGLERLACRFDYRRLSNGGVDGGSVFPVAAVANEHACSNAELTDKPDDPPPTADQLDYALLQLANPVEADRGSIKLPADPPPVAPDDPLIIVQHPSGGPLQFAIDTDAVIGMRNKGLRLRYRTNTEPGSSGSPCFSMDWDLLALHHLGDPTRGTPIYNQGVPIGLIRHRIEADGFAALLAG